MDAAQLIGFVYVEGTLDREVYGDASGICLGADVFM